MSARRLRYGILGGTFDPVHNAHVALASLMMTDLAIDELAVVPSGQSWQKSATETSAAQRTEMLRLAFEPGALSVQIDERELHRAGPSFTVDTLVELRAQRGADTALILILGSDQLPRLDTWHRWEEIFGLAHIAVAARPGFPLTDEIVDGRLREQLHARLKPVSGAFATPAGDLVTISANLGDVSSSHIRALVAAGKYPEVAALVPAPVLDYIRGNKLYRH